MEHDYGFYSNANARKIKKRKEENLSVYTPAASKIAGTASQIATAPPSLREFATSSVHKQCTFSAGCAILFIPIGGTASDGLPNTPA